MKKIHIKAAVFILSALILHGCSNIFLERPQEQPEQLTASPDIPEGFGAVRVNFFQGSARTVMPGIDLAGLYLEYLFAKDAEAAEEKAPVDGKFILEPGDYTLTVQVFVDGDKTLLAAEGTSASFTITAGVDAGTVDLTLHPVVSGEGTGSLEFALQYPAGVTVVTLTLTRIAGDETLNLTGAASGGDPVTYSGSRSAIPVGYYILRVRLRNSAGDFAGKSEVVHIYQNLTARTVLAEYTFEAADFNASLVTNANDAGPGSLRQAIADANAQAGQTIRLKLEPGSVIELQSPLPAVTAGVTIEGNGVTLTPASSWTGGSASHLLLINSSSAAVTVRRVHFKNGLVQNYGGAIRNFGDLTLESCIFSGNSITNSGAVGGAISSGNILTIRGCTFYGNTGYRGGAVDFSGSALTLTGNLFYGNTAANDYPVLYSTGTAVISSYNVVDIASGTGGTDCGWTHDATDLQVSALPISPKTFKVLDGSAAAARLPSKLPEHYPAVDFYGETVRAGGPAGAIQTLTANGIGYSWLDLSVNNSLAGRISVNPAPDEDGLVPNGSVTFTAIPAGAASTFEQWLVDGVPDSETSTTLTLTISTPTGIHAVFSRVVTVSSFNDSGGGTLREALANLRDRETISVSGVTPGTTTIELESPLEITKNITIKGNGVTLSPAASWTSNSTSQLLRITDSSALVTISGVHFKNGLTTNNGGTVYNTGNLTLESCIFSGNRASYGGGIFSTNDLTLRGCTFYNNSAYGGAVYFDASGKTLTLTGNVFYGNTGGSYPVVYANGTVISSYNVVDIASGTGTTACGWTYDATDIQAAALPISPITFKVLYGSTAAAILPAPLPADYPAVDFYGQPVSGNGTAGAVQALTASGYSYLYLSVNNSRRGSVSVSPLPDADGLVPNGSLTLTATPSSEVYPFAYWLVDGVEETANPHTLTISAHTRIQAVFSRLITVSSAGDSGGGTLREALTNAEGSDIITLSGVTPGTTVIELANPLPQITQNITIEGNGVTLTPASSWTSGSASHLLYVNNASAAVTVRQVHFKNGLVQNYGGAIRNFGNLTLESCIFSGNSITNSGAVGGAISSGNILTIRGCTFYGNTGYRGGALDFSGSTLTLTGNLFYGNTGTNDYPVLYSTGTAVISSYNVVDAAFGTGNTECGWTQGTGDLYSPDLPVSPKTFKLLSGSPAAGQVPGTLPADYPAEDFYGETISAGGAAGAIQAAAENQSGYYYLELTVNNSLRGLVTASPSPDEDGLVPGGFISISAEPSAGYALEHWLVDGVETAAPPAGISAHTLVQAVFYPVVTVFTDGAGSETTPGTLRHALTNLMDGDTVTFNGVTAGTTAIELAGPLPEITKSVTLEGNGVTLTRTSSWVSNYTSQLLRITNTSAAVTVRRVHFKNGLTSGGGGAIRKVGILILESCVFSGNQSPSYEGGAVYNYEGRLTIRGCTFYGNTSSTYGGAVNGSATLTGNLFYGNSAAHGSQVIRGSVSASYNVVDVDFGRDSTQCGWTQGTGDVSIGTSLADLPVSLLSFRLLAGSGAAAILPGTLPEDYPAEDFYGQPISAGGAAGAVQGITASGYSYLDLPVNDSQRGSILVNSAPDADGLVPNGTIITANPNSGYSLLYWMVDGVKTTTPSLTVSAHTRIQAVFGRAVNVFTDGTGSETIPGTLRYVLTNAQNGDIIVFDGVTPGTTTVTLESPLPEIITNVTIEGNGVVLTRGSSWVSSLTSQLLRITGADAAVKISRVHFKNGYAFDSGGAILNAGILTLESCIFSGNYSPFGGAVCCYNTLTIRGCTFYNNSGGYGGAVFFSNGNRNTQTLTGNLFYGNTATNYYPVVGSRAGDIPPIIPSYNVVDVVFGTGFAYCGWAARTGDATFTALGISGDPFNTTSFAPVSGLQIPGVLPSTAPADFPLTDFYGTARTFPGAPGAVAAGWEPPPPPPPPPISDIIYSNVSGGAWTLENDGRRKSPVIGDNVVTKARVSFTSTGDDQVITVQLDVSSESGYDWAFISALDNADATSSSGYYARISGTQSETVNIPVPTEGSHFVEIGYQKDYSDSDGSDCAWFKVLE